MFIRKVSSVRRSFQIPIIIPSSFGGRDARMEKAKSLVGGWMKKRLEDGKPCLTSGFFIEGCMIFAWKPERSCAMLNHEDAVIFVGEVKPTSHTDLDDKEVMAILEDLTGYLGDELNKPRMTFMYRDEIVMLSRPSQMG